MKNINRMNNVVNSKCFKLSNWKQMNSQYVDKFYEDRGLRDQNSRPTCSFGIKIWNSSENSLILSQQ
jgi:hypothetical protein